MAYIFNKINQQLDPAQQKQDIFGGQGIAPQPGGGQAQQPGDIQQVKTSTEGADVGGGAAGGSTQAGENIPQDQAKQSTAVIKRNVGKVSTPSFAQKIGQDLQTADQRLQEEANKYVQAAEGSAVGLGSDVYGKAVSGDKEAFGKISGFLGRSGKAEAEKYGAFRPETDYDIEDVQSLRGSGLSALLRREAGGSLSQREVDLDRAVLERSPEFINIRNQLLGQQSSLSAKASGLQESQTAKAREAIESGIGRGQEAVRAGLGSEESALRSGIERRVAEENAKRQALAAGGNKEFIAAQQKAALQELMADLATDPSGAGRYIEDVAGTIDASQFYDRGRDVGFADLVSQDEASKFNIINALLGRGDIVSAGGGAGTEQGFRGNAYYDAVRSAVMEKDAAAKAAAQAEIDRVARIKAAEEAQIQANIEANRHTAEGIAARDAERAAAAQAAADEEAARKERESRRVVRVAGQPTGVERGWWDQASYEDRKRTGNTAGDPLRTGREDFQKEKSTAHATADKIEGGIKKGAGKAKKAGGKVASSGKKLLGRG